MNFETLKLYIYFSEETTKLIKDAWQWLNVPFYEKELKHNGPYGSCDTNLMMVSKTVRPHISGDHFYLIAAGCFVVASTEVQDSLS